MNASEAIGDRDAVVRVTVRRVKVGQDRLAWIPEELAEDDYVQLEIADTGKGMAPETRARVFVSFPCTRDRTAVHVKLSLPFRVKVLVALPYTRTCHRIGVLW
jgi:nitrogen fixation/metabolism regulation signal transduction histidine kinase